MNPDQTRLHYICTERDGDLVAEIPMGKYVLTVSCYAVSRRPYMDLSGYWVNLEYFWTGETLVELHAPDRVHSHANARYIQIALAVAHDARDWSNPPLDSRQLEKLGSVESLGLSVYQHPAISAHQYLVFERAWDGLGRPFTLHCELGWVLTELDDAYEPSLPLATKPGCGGSIYLAEDLRLSIVRHAYLGPKQYLKLREELLSRISVLPSEKEPVDAVHVQPH